MSDSDCEKAKKSLEEYLHHELCTDDTRDIRNHIEGCPECESEYRVGVVLKDAVQRACKEVAPEELRDQVLLRLRSIQAEHV
ncbi:zf-HC2 domain-containing protein [Lysinibacter sp. HNR]|uniref:zf-HC2 domain-containing protein n=1 Tax=Lysinibacter sp. HNR TaxID=3031408 RepID=UPI00243612E3|nr:zf-HC2 domain-containing protein [Lysinibacter sp. HNR]WGD36936.1 zf-HC2 domain-containing protein [Lysinibacter sp. HNR]